MLKEELSPTAFFKKKTSMDKRFYLALKLNFYIDAFMYSIILLNQSINSCIMPPISFFLLSSYSLAKQFCSTVFVFLLFIYLFFTVSCISIRVNMNTTSPVNQRRSWLSELDWTFRLLLLSLHLNKSAWCVQRGTEVMSTGNEDPHHKLLI